MNDLNLNDDERLTTRRAKRDKLPLRRIVVFAVLIGFFALVWYAFSQGQQIGGSQVTPIIKADAEPFKVKPDQPGGMEIPHQDKMIYDELQGKNDQGVTEKLLPPPEKPIAKDSASDATSAPVTSTSPANLASNDMPNDVPENIGLLPAQNVEPLPTPAVKHADQPGEKSADKPSEKPAPKVVEPIVKPEPTAAAPKTEKAAPAPSVKPAENKTEAKAETKPETKAAVTAPESAKPPTPAVAKAPASGKFRVQLASLPDKANADKMASLLASKNKGVLANHPVSVAEADIPGKGKYYRIQATGFSDRAEATAMCALLKSANQGCIPVAQ
jgi:hypothetical protein